jgi:hypothetical protein
MDVNQRLIVVQNMADKKGTLFEDPLSPSLTRHDKEKAWEQIRTSAVAAGCTSLANKPWQYVRDSVWAGARRDAIRKRDLAHQSGEGRVRFSQVFEGIGMDFDEFAPFL